MNLQLWQRHPDATRNVLVVMLGLLVAMVGTVLYQIGSDPWGIVGLVVGFAVVARWILERAGFTQLLSEIAHVAWWLLKAALVIGIAVWMFLKIPTWQ